MSLQCTDTVVLVKPAAFGLNEDAHDNAFINFQTNISNPQIQALQEFDVFKQALEEKGIRVIVFEDTPETQTPDSIFPNNVVSTHDSGKVIFYAMKPENRSLEVVKHREWIDQLEDEGYEITEVVDYSPARHQGKHLEGTGVMILDRVNKIAYAAKSERVTPELFEKWGTDHGYQTVLFTAEQKHPVSGEMVSVYHTNFMMSIGQKFVAICWELIADESERENLKNLFKKTGKHIIPLTLKQFENSAANILEVKNKEGQHFIVISQRAYDQLDHSQKEDFERCGCKIITADISTIEEIGGGSVRCMMMEVFLPRNTK